MLVFYSQNPEIQKNALALVNALFSRAANDKKKVCSSDIFCLHPHPFPPQASTLICVDSF